MFQMLKSEIVCPLINNPMVCPIFLLCFTAWPEDFAEKRILKLVEWFSGHCRAIKS